MNSLIRFTKGFALIVLGFTVALLGLGLAAWLSRHGHGPFGILGAFCFFGTGIVLVERGMGKW